MELENLYWAKDKKNITYFLVKRESFTCTITTWCEWCESDNFKKIKQTDRTLRVVFSSSWSTSWVRDSAARWADSATLLSALASPADAIAASSSFSNARIRRSWAYLNLSKWKLHTSEKSKHVQTTLWYDIWGHELWKAYLIWRIQLTVAKDG